MPPKRRSAARAASSQQQHSQQQSKLSFHGKQSRVTKSSQTAAQQGKKNTKKDPALLEDHVGTDNVTIPQGEPDLADPTTAEKAIQHQTKEERSTLDDSGAPDPLSQDVQATRTEDVLGGRAPVSDAGAVGGTGAGWVGDEETRARKVTDSQIKRYWKQKEEERLAPRIHQQDLNVYEKVLREWDMSGQYGPCIGIARLKRWKRANQFGLNPPLEVLAVLLKELEKGSDDADAQRAYVDKLMTSRYVEN